LLTACAGQSALNQRIAPLHGHDPIAIADVDIQSVSPEMEAFLDRYVDPKESVDRKARDLVLAATDRNSLWFEYDPALTLNSVQTFAERRGNCLAFSTMLVALARHSGLKAYYQEVEIPPQWNNVKNNLLFSLHVNVVVEGRSGEWVVDISGRDAVSSRKIHRLTDEEVLAQYYNNLGADALMNEDLALAYAYFVGPGHRSKRPSSGQLAVFPAVTTGTRGRIRHPELDPDSSTAATTCS
jgi:hypothetical protein